MNRILVVEDDAALRRALEITLRVRGYDVRAVGTAAEALAVADEPVDMVVLDLGLPDLDGTEVVRRLRHVSRVPVLVLSAREGQSDKVTALDAGADDYLTKPFSTDELLARVRAAIRRGRPAEPAPVVQAGAFTVDLAMRRVTRADGEVKLTPTEWDLLAVLARQPGVLVEQSDLLREVWGPAYGTETNYLRVYMSQLRHKLEPDPAHPRHLLTEPGVGYRLEL